MKKELEEVVKEIEERLKVQRKLMQQFAELSDEETACRLRILNTGYSHCLMMIKGVLNTKG